MQVDLSEADLSGAPCKGADLSGANIWVPICLRQTLSWLACATHM
ncbi:MAG: pentapeptide repeat-containing protein [Ktedonobacterales bacterium]